MNKTCHISLLGSISAPKHEFFLPWDDIPKCACNATRSNHLSEKLTSEKNHLACSFLTLNLIEKILSINKFDVNP